MLGIQAKKVKEVKFQFVAFHENPFIMENNVLMENMAHISKLWVDENNREYFSGSTIFFAHLGDLRKKLTRKK